MYPPGLAQQAWEAKTPLIVGIVNCTPDSFSDGGEVSGHSAVARAHLLFEQGADAVDLGGESSRPGSDYVSEEEEAARVLPVLKELLREISGHKLSVDTRRSSIAHQACELGVRTINDVSALSDHQMLGVVAAHKANIILMHSRGTPKLMQSNTQYSHLVDEVEVFLKGLVEQAKKQGLKPSQIAIDPGIGFGKEWEDNLTLIQATPRFAQIAPVMIGASRKRFIGQLLHLTNPKQRVAGSVGVALAAAAGGAKLLRVHDVEQTHQALTMFLACR